MGRSLALAGVAALAVAGFGGLAEACSHNAAEAADAHVMSVRLPGGGVEQVQYTGNVAPEVVVLPDDSLPAFFGPDSPFALLDRISAQMERQADALFRQVETMAALPMLAPGQVTEASFANLPPGVHGYFYSATLSGNGGCVHSMQMTSMGKGQKPRVVSETSGNCSTDNNAGAPVRLPTVQSSADRPDVVRVRYEGTPAAKPVPPFRSADAWE